MDKNIIDTEIVELDGFITSYKYESDDDYRIAFFKIDDNKQERTITIVGYYPHYNKIQETRETVPKAKEPHILI